MMAQSAHRNPKNAFNEKGEKVRGESYWAQVPLTMVGAGLTGSAWAVWITLDGMQGKKPYCYPGIKYLCGRTNQTPATIKRAIASLEKSRFLLVERQRGSKNRYYVINGARRPGEEMEPSEPSLMKKPRKNNLSSKESSKIDLQVSSKMYKSGPIFEPIIRSTTKSTSIRSIEREKPPQSPVRLVQTDKRDDFLRMFESLSE